MGTFTGTCVKTTRNNNNKKESFHFEDQVEEEKPIDTSMHSFFRCKAMFASNLIDKELNKNRALILHSEQCIIKLFNL